MDSFYELATMNKFFEFSHRLHCRECVGNGTIRDYRRGTVITIQERAEKELVFRAGLGGGEV